MICIRLSERLIGKCVKIKQAMGKNTHRLSADYTNQLQAGGEIVTFPSVLRLSDSLTLFTSVKSFSLWFSVDNNLDLIRLYECFMSRHYFLSISFPALCQK